MLEAEDWSVAVVKCRMEDLAKIIVGLSDVLEDLKAALSYHFTLRDSTNQDIWLSFRVCRAREDADIVESTMRGKLNEMISKDRFEVPPTSKKFEDRIKFSPFTESRERVANYWGTEDNWKTFCEFLNRLSIIVVDMVRKNQYDANKRVDIGHLLMNMLGIAHSKTLYDRLTKSKFCYS